MRLMTKGNTALHLACIYGHLEVVQYLASEIKLNLDILNLDGQTCFHLASKHGQFLIMQYLSSINANISCKNEKWKYSTSYSLSTWLSEYC